MGSGPGARVPGPHSVAGGGAAGGRAAGRGRYLVPPPAIPCPRFCVVFQRPSGGDGGGGGGGGGATTVLGTRPVLAMLQLWRSLSPEWKAQVDAGIAELAAAKGCAMPAGVAAGVDPTPTPTSTPVVSHADQLLHCRFGSTCRLAARSATLVRCDGVSGVFHLYPVESPSVPVTLHLPSTSNRATRQSHGSLISGLREAMAGGRAFHVGPLVVEQTLRRGAVTEQSIVLRCLPESALVVMEPPLLAAPSAQREVRTAEGHVAALVWPAHGWLATACPADLLLRFGSLLGPGATVPLSLTALQAAVAGGVTPWVVLAAKPAATPEMPPTAAGITELFALSQPVWHALTGGLAAAGTSGPDVPLTDVAALGVLLCHLVGAAGPCSTPAALVVKAEPTVPLGAVNGGDRASRGPTPPPLFRITDVRRAR